MELILDQIYEPETIPVNNLGYIGIVTMKDNKWVIVRLEGTDTWEFPGGAIDEGETPLEAAERELFEEAGTIKSDIDIIGQYSIKSGGKITFGNLYFANIQEIGPLPDFEIEEVRFVKNFPIQNTRHPKVIPELFEFAKNKIHKKGLHTLP